jgi:hypothetical protein
MTARRFRLIRHHDVGAARRSAGSIPKGARIRICRCAAICRPVRGRTCTPRPNRIQPTRTTDPIRVVHVIRTTKPIVVHVIRTIRLVRTAYRAQPSDDPGTPDRHQSGRPQMSCTPIGRSQLGRSQAGPSESAWPS